MPETLQKKVLTKIVNSLEKDQRVGSIFVTGSLKNKKITDFSDIDLWIIFSEESGLNIFKQEIASVFSKFGIINGVYDCTAHHFFVVYKNGVQIDLNLVSAAQYFSIKSDDGKTKILFDRQLYLSDRSKFLEEHKNYHLKKYLLIGYTTLERCVSKFLKQDYFVAVRFLDSVRHNAILPLLPFVEDQRISNAVALEIERLSPKIKELFIRTYSKPTFRGNLESMMATLEILGDISAKVNISEFKERHAAIEKILLKTEQE